MESLQDPWNRNKHADLTKHGNANSHALL
jgi:hypothetical protein